MTHSGQFLSSFDNLWTEFSDAWKKARTRASEKSIHRLRVSTRRLIATLELTRAMSKLSDIAKLQRRFKRVLKGMGPLRDLQVQLQIISEMKQSTPILEDFQRSLKRRETRQIASIHDDLKRATRRRLTAGAKNVRAEYERLHEKPGEEKIYNAVERVLKLRRNEFLKTRRRFKPSEESTLHEMRIALKKLRYSIEAAQPVLDASAEERAREMHTFQQLLGDTRDAELLRTRLEKWAAKRGFEPEVVPAMEALQARREGLMGKIIESAAALDNIFPEAQSRPAIEKVLASVPAGSDGPSQASRRRTKHIGAAGR